MDEQQDFGDDLKECFDKATNFVKSEAGKMNSTLLLHFYARFKQANEGSCTGSRPSLFNYQARQKWDAWNALGHMSKESAMQEYIDAVMEYDFEWEEKMDSGKIKKNSGMGVAVSTLKHNEDEIEKSDEDKSIFDWCIEGNVHKVAEFLQRDGNDVNIRDENGLTLLHWAADRGHDDIVTLLIEKFAADINAKDNEGQAPLHYAVSNEHPTVVQILLSHGALTNLKDNDGMSPREMATGDILTMFSNIRS